MSVLLSELAGQVAATHGLDDEKARTLVGGYATWLIAEAAPGDRRLRVVTDERIPDEAADLIRQAIEADTTHRPLLPCPTWCDREHGRPLLGCEPPWHSHCVAQLERADGEPGDVLLYGAEDETGDVQVQISVLADLTAIESAQEARAYALALLDAANQLEAVQAGQARR